MHMIDQGFEEVIWIDSDIIVSRSAAAVFSGLKSDALLATEDALGDERDDRDALRARLWGLPVGRVLPFGLNSGVLRVTKDHYRLMERWWELLQSNVYQEFQRRAWRQRPIHMLGDQDVLTALLTSEEFSEIPVRILRRGRHILQFNGVYGYTVAERMRNLLGDRPAFIHSFGGKPWSETWLPEPSIGLREYIKKLYLDLSPYTLSAMRFTHGMGSDTEWMKPHYLLSRIMRALGMGCPALVGMPMAIFADLTRIVKHIRKSRGSNHSRPETDRLESVGKW
jgi:lipopolysaccharide biosynthesis glycosyltransferase